MISSLGRLSRLLTTGLLAGLFICAILSLAGEVLPDGLIGFWQCDDTSGNRLSDSSGKGHHGSLHGAKFVQGKSKGALECGTDALVEVPCTAALNEMPLGISVAGWVKRTPDAKWNMIISREVKDGPSEYFGLAVFKNKALFSVDPDGAHYKNIQSVEDMPSDEWIHLAGTFDNHVMKLYVNGKLVRTGVCDVSFKFADENPVIIGGNTNSKGKTWVDCFHGLIDDMRLYNRSLTESEIGALATPK